MIEARDLWHIYDPDQDANKAVKGIDIEIEKGKNIVIVGENGSGKTTFVKHFNGLLKPSKGKILIDGENTKNKTVAELASKVGFVFQNPEHQIFGKDVLEEIRFGPQNLDMDLDDEIHDLLNYMDLERYEKRSPHNLSGGEKQRLAIASVLIMGPDYLILDEPTTGLDLKGMKRILEIIMDLKDQKKSVITVTHDLDLAKSADRVIVMHEGEVVLDGGPKEVLMSENLEKFGLEPPKEVKISKELGIRPNFDVDEIVELLRGAT